ncbi:RNA-binding protein 34-like isoform X1 [Acropora millepora]|uniref:RNA-binding protein 34-like isoform X1 n=1 Tax=Acropora millepora TaxID=45264 RepID=UPI001CF57D93|nr:RNA-binding protein 34-like isoform X1 [Acropora millepora]
MAASGMLAEFKVGEISQALLSKPKKKKVERKENSELDALFSTAGLFQPQFVSAASISKAPEATKKSANLSKNQKCNCDTTEGKDATGGTEGKDATGEAFAHGSRKRKVPTKDDENDDRRAQRMKRKKFFSNKEVEDPERLARTVFVGNLPVALTKRKLKQLFVKYGEVESVRFRSAALAQPHFSRKVAMKNREELHTSRQNINGYVVFKEKECAVKALKRNGKEVDGLHIRVDLTGQESEHDHARSIFIGNLRFDAEEENIRQAFADCGTIESVRIVRDNKTGIGKGFGFVLFKKKEAVMFAIRKNGTDFNGRSLRVFPSSENPRKGHFKESKKGKANAFSFSGVTAKRGIKNENIGNRRERPGKKGIGLRSKGLSSKPAKSQHFKKPSSAKKHNVQSINREKFQGTRKGKSR